jgi:hypothetical protein
MVEVLETRKSASCVHVTRIKRFDTVIIVVERFKACVVTHDTRRRASTSSCNKILVQDQLSRTTTLAGRL